MNTFEDLLLEWGSSVSLQNTYLIPLVEFIVKGFCSSQNKYSNNQAYVHSSDSFRGMNSLYLDVLQQSLNYHVKDAREDILKLGGKVVADSSQVYLT